MQVLLCVPKEVTLTVLNFATVIQKQLLAPYDYFLRFHLQVFIVINQTNMSINSQHNVPLIQNFDGFLLSNRSFFDKPLDGRWNDLYERSWDAKFMILLETF